MTYHRKNVAVIEANKNFKLFNHEIRDNIRYLKSEIIPGNNTEISI